MTGDRPKFWRYIMDDEKKNDVDSEVVALSKPLLENDEQGNQGYSSLHTVESMHFKNLSAHFGEEVPRSKSFHYGTSVIPQDVTTESRPVRSSSSVFPNPFWANAGRSVPRGSWLSFDENSSSQYETGVVKEQQLSSSAPNSKRLAALAEATSTDYTEVPVDAPATFASVAEDRGTMTEASTSEIEYYDEVTTDADDITLGDISS